MDSETVETLLEEPLALSSNTQKSDSASDQSDACIICHEPFNTGAEPEISIPLPCNHRIGLACAAKWFLVPDRDHGCPYCQQNPFNRPEGAREPEDLFMEVQPEGLWRLALKALLITGADIGLSWLIRRYPGPQRQWLKHYLGMRLQHRVYSEIGQWCLFGWADYQRDGWMVTGLRYYGLVSTAYKAYQFIYEFLY